MEAVDSIAWSPNLQLMYRFLAVLIFPTLLACAAHAETPAGVTLGEGFASARPRIEAACSRTEIMRYTGAMAAPAREEQIQLDCYGLNIYGGPRKVEFMFNDGVLAFMWILLAPAESDRIRAEFVTARGAPIYERDGYAVFRDGQIAIRTSPPEVLVANAAMMAEITGYRP